MVTIWCPILIMSFIQMAKLSNIAFLSEKVTQLIDKPNTPEFDSVPPSSVCVNGHNSALQDARINTMLAFSANARHY